MFDERAYDRTISYDLNKRRRDEVDRGYYEEIAQQDKIDAHKNYMFNKQIQPAEIRMSMEELRMRIMYEENLKRAKIARLFDAERRAYLTIVKQREQYERSEEVEMSRLEQKADQIREEKVQRTQQFNQEAYSQEWEQNCDELRGADAKIQAHACRLQWDIQNMQKRKINERETFISKQIDSIAVNDYKQYKLDEIEAQKQKAVKVSNTIQQYEQHIAEQNECRQQEEQKEKEFEQKEKALRDFGAEIERVSKDVELERNLFNRAELECQMAAQESKQKAEYKEEIFDGKQLIKQIEEEQKEAEMLKYAKMKMEYEDQLAMLEIENYRKSVKEAEERAIDEYFVENVNSRDKVLQQNEEKMLLKRKQLENECYEGNLQIDQYKAEQDRLHQENKRAELEAAQEQIREMKAEKLAQLEQKLKDQREYLAYLYMQDDVRAGKKRATKSEDIDYANSQKEALQRDLQEIQKRLGNEQQRLEEMDNIKFQQEGRPTLKQRQWYNV